MEENCTVSVLKSVIASEGDPVLNIDEIKWEEGYGGTDEEKRRGQGGCF